MTRAHSGTDRCSQYVVADFLVVSLAGRHRRSSRERTQEMSGGFWLQPCPSRGPALRHAHWVRCEIEHQELKHAATQCCHCGAKPSDKLVRVEVTTMIVENDFHEPKMVTGEGPSGPASAIGRGWSPSDEIRLEFVAFLVREGRLQP